MRLHTNIVSRFALAALLAAVCSSAALAQNGESANGDAIEAANPEALVVTSCGPMVNSRVFTQNVPSATNSVAFVNLVGTNIVVPAGASRCIKVLFTAQTACRGPAAVGDFCYVRALINGVEMNPQGGGVQVFDSEDPTPSAHAYEWVRRVRAGNQVIVIQRRVGNAATSFLLDDWTFDVQVLQ